MEHFKLLIFQIVYEADYLKAAETRDLQFFSHLQVNDSKFFPNLYKLMWKYLHLF